MLQTIATALTFFLIHAMPAFAQSFSTAEVENWEIQAARIQLFRDEWGIPHVYGQTDADAVFGLIFAQCEDDFPRVERNYIEKLGRLSEIQGKNKIYEDLLIRLLIDTAAAKAEFDSAPVQFKKLLQAWSDGIHFFLYTHPQTTPALLTRFEPWFPLLWTDGSIGAINTADLTVEDLRLFYGEEGISGISEPKRPVVRDQESGSNGFAIAPKKSASGHAMLYINPHTTFYFRPEVHMVSEEGLNAYGAVTWGQFFIYQGFNADCGWMHTSHQVDVADTYAEEIISKEGELYYFYQKKWLPVARRPIEIRYIDGEAMRLKSFTTYATHHGPVMASRQNRWISLRSNNRSIQGLMQSWLRTKSTGWRAFQQTMRLRSNVSNNTVFADSRGHIAYWHGNFVPVRKKGLDCSQWLDGTLASTEWKGVHPLHELVHLHNPDNGWIQNCNSTPYTAAGSRSPNPSKYRTYMAPDGENFRGVHAVRLLEASGKIRLEDLIRIGYDTRLSAFEWLIPALLKIWDRKDISSQYPLLEGPIEILRSWDYRCSETSVATSIAVAWAERLHPSLQQVYITEGQPDQVENARRFATLAGPEDMLPQLAEVIRYYEQTFGSWQISWGEINRFQRIAGGIETIHQDSLPSWPVGFASPVWGCLPAYKSAYPSAKARHRYGHSGNSFVCAVEFGEKVRALSLLAGGVSGDPLSPHFTDQALSYTKGLFKEVYFYKEDVIRHARERYQPGRR